MSELSPVGDTTPAGDEPGAVHDTGPVVVVTAMSLSRTARAELASRLGPGHVVRGIREAGNAADIVLVPPASTQLIGALRAMFPGAKILITELTDPEFGLSFTGPMQRALDSGVDGYFLAVDLDRLATVTREVAAGGPVGALTAGGDQLARALGTATRGSAGLHLGVGYTPTSAHRLARELGAIRLDVADGAARLYGPAPDADQLSRLAELVWELVREILDRGGAVLLDADPVWVDRAASAGLEVQYHQG